MQNAAEAYGGRLRTGGRDHGTASQMSDSVDDFTSQGGGGENPYDHPTSLSLPKLISKQNQRKGARDWYDSASSVTGPHAMMSQSQVSYGGVPFNQNHVDLMIQDGILRQNMEMNSEI